MNFLRTAIAFAAIALCACGNAGPGGKQPASISPAEVSRQLSSSPKPVLLDVRTQEEFAEGHIAGARLIPWSGNDFETRATKELDRSKPVVVYCRSGKRSSAAAEKLAALGFTDVRNVRGGTLAWRKEGLPLTPSR